MRNPSILRRLVLLAFVALAGIAVAAGPAQAQRPTVGQQLQHYLECLEWMFSDPARHAKECAPGHVYIIPDPKSSGSDEPDCEYMVPSAFMPVGRGYDDCPPPPCYEKSIGFVQSTYGGDCYEPCRDFVGFNQVGDTGCYEPIPCGGSGGASLTVVPHAQPWLLVAEEYEWPPEGGCPTMVPLNADELILYAI